ncbi:hypothetical protein ACFWDI_00710 [Streptomyces sp. NPDC060064]|uniref:hypothetical protein n=1 Tax=Streptomyces sp. NPDC060064 TaxID=3347049 RepID=UPI00368299E4
MVGKGSPQTPRQPTVARQLGQGLSGLREGGHPLVVPGGTAFWRLRAIALF